MRAIILTPVRFAKSAKHSASIGPSFPDRRAASKVAYRPLSTIARTTHDVCFWHKADIRGRRIDVCYWVKADIAPLAQVECWQAMSALGQKRTFLIV